MNTTTEVEEEVGGGGKHEGISTFQTGQNPHQHVELWFILQMWLQTLLNFFLTFPLWGSWLLIGCLVCLVSSVRNRKHGHVTEFRHFGSSEGFSCSPDVGLQLIVTADPEQEVGDTKRSRGGGRGAGGGGGAGIELQTETKPDIRSAESFIVEVGGSNDPMQQNLSGTFFITSKTLNQIHLPRMVVVSPVPLSDSHSSALRVRKRNQLEIKINRFTLEWRMLPTQTGNKKTNKEENK